MHKIQKIMSACVLLLICLSASAGAVEFSNSELNFEVLSFDNFLSRAAPIYGDVRQGDVDYHMYYVPVGDSNLELVLIWNEEDNSDLMLTVYLPTSSTMSFHDTDDGISDNRISLNFTVPPTMSGKNWRFGVTGVVVSGTEDYTLIINSY